MAGGPQAGRPRQAAEQAVGWWQQQHSLGAKCLSQVHDARTDPLGPSPTPSPPTLPQGLGGSGSVCPLHLALRFFHALACTSCNPCNQPVAPGSWRARGGHKEPGATCWAGFGGLVTRKPGSVVGSWQGSSRQQCWEGPRVGALVQGGCQGSKHAMKAPLAPGGWGGMAMAPGALTLAACWQQQAGSSSSSSSKGAATAADTQPAGKHQSLAPKTS